MGKNVVAGAFVLLSLYAVFIFMQKDSARLRDQVSRSEKDPRVILEDFTLYRYRGHRVLSTLSGRIAHFIEPNSVEMYGSLRGLRYDTVNREYFSAESAAIYFVGTGMMQLMKGAEVERAEIDNNVKVGSAENLIETDYAQYLADRNRLRSDVPVVFTSPKSKLKGQTGFEYDLELETVELFGPMEGVLQSDTKLSL